MSETQGRDSRRSSFFRKFIDTKHGRTHYILRGSDDGELVVFLHGMTKYSYIFDDLTMAVDEAGHRALTFDFYGRGFSDAGKGKHNAQFYVDHTVEVLQELGLWLESFTLVGFSMGGAVAAEFARQYPSKVKRICLLSPAGINMKYGGAAAARIPLLGLAGAHALGKSALLNYDASKDFHDVDSEANDEAIRFIQEKTEFQVNKGPAFVSACAKTLYWFEWSGLGKTFKEIGTHSRPAACVWAKNDKQTPIAGATKLKEFMPGCDIKEVDNCGHMVMQEAASDCKEVLLDLLKRDPPMDAAAPEDAAPSQRRVSVSVRN